ncbi:hypothetical protein EXIGLDRAFT_161612 [Exidia glandulosa HHB12029]|uniref:Uncharacterized protein n=1 Tax=Exidia glandulosa HHB12029 TaxID=1314781 RepID=A0A165FGM3_EXIGL|nr:hypothetical protein EXIGLDRAFT_161612 [Exidia glandulosa HHB12029]
MVPPEIGIDRQIWLVLTPLRRNGGIPSATCSVSHTQTGAANTAKADCQHAYDMLSPVSDEVWDWCACPSGMQGCETSRRRIVQRPYAGACASMNVSTTVCREDRSCLLSTVYAQRPCALSTSPTSRTDNVWHGWETRSAAPRSRADTSSPPR